MEAVDVRGRFVWHQLMTRDVPGAKKFYTELLGWKLQAWPLDPDYTVCHAEGSPVAGIIEITDDLPADVPTHWVQFIGTRDVDATAAAAVRAGGVVVTAPSEMKGAGRYALLQDPQGALFAIIDPENARPEVVGTPPPGDFTWHELATTDHEAAFAFYSALFGWDAITRMDMGPAGVYLIFGTKGVQRGGMYLKPAEAPGPSHWMPYAHVPSVDSSVGVATESGAKILNAPMDVAGGSRIASMTDPSGAGFAIHSFPKPKPEAPVKAKAPVKKKAKAKVKSAAKKPVKKKVVKKTMKSKSKNKAKPKGKGKGKAKKPKVARRKK